LDSQKLQLGINILDLLAVETSIFSSKGEARKMVQANGFSLNKSKLSDIEYTLGASDVLHGKYIIAQKGKKNYFVIALN